MSFPKVPKSEQKRKKRIRTKKSKNLIKNSNKIPIDSSHPYNLYSRDSLKAIESRRKRQNAIHTSKESFQKLFRKNKSIAKTSKIRKDTEDSKMEYFGSLSTKLPKWITSHPFYKPSQRRAKLVDVIEHIAKKPVNLRLNLISFFRAREIAIATSRF